MTRDEQITSAAAKHCADKKEGFGQPDCDFIMGARWADNNPAWMETLDLLHDHKLMREALEFYCDSANAQLDMPYEFVASGEQLFGTQAKETLSKLKVK